MKLILLSAILLTTSTGIMTINACVDFLVAKAMNAEIFANSLSEPH